MQVQKEGVANSPEYYEWFVIRILCTCFFELGMAARKKTWRNLAAILCGYWKRIFRNITKIKKAGLFSDADVPMPQKAATALLKFLVHTRLIYPVSRCLARDKK